MEVTETLENQVGVTENVATETQEQAKTFTQEEVNKMMETRVYKERQRYADYEELKEKAQKFDEMGSAENEALAAEKKRADELQKQLDELTQANTIRSIKEKVSAEIGVPANLLTGTDEETCRAQAEAIKAYAGAHAYPTVKDAGETIPPSTTKSDILSIKDEKARLKAIEANIELF